MTRARMFATRDCVYRVDDFEAGKAQAVTGEVLAYMMFECVVRQACVIAGDAHKMVYQMTGQPFFLHQTKKAYFSVLSGSYGEHIGSLLEDTDPKCSYSHHILPELQYLRDVLEGKPDIEDDIRKNTMTMGDCCALSFFEYGLSMKKDHQKDNFYDKELTDELEYIYSVNEGLFFLTNEVFLLKERESDAHCPITVRFVQTEDYF